METLSWARHDRSIAECEKCPRLRAHCLKTAREKRKAYAGQTYWGRPVHGFGDHKARLVLIGLAPAAHGANRTGRMFTGDRSGDWLYRAMHRAGFASQAQSISRGDGLALDDAFVTAAARCAPPGNKPTPTELSRCRDFLLWELERLRGAKVYLGLGKIGFDTAWDALKALGRASGPRPGFSHGASVRIGDAHLLGSYHPSQQNTFTGRLTEAMLDSVFAQARRLL